MIEGTLVECSVPGVKDSVSLRTSDNLSFEGEFVPADDLKGGAI